MSTSEDAKERPPQGCYMPGNYFSKGYVKAYPLKIMGVFVAGHPDVQYPLIPARAPGKLTWT